MNIDFLKHAPFAPGKVREVAVPPAARRASTLTRIDYEDGFLVEGASAWDRTPEAWARAILEGAPRVLRDALSLAWSSLGLRIGSGRSDRLVHGWQIRRSTADLVLLGAGSRVGMPAELLFKRQRSGLLFSTFVQQDNLLARATWAAIAVQHRGVVRYVLEQASSPERHSR